MKVHSNTSNSHFRLPVAITIVSVIILCLFIFLTQKGVLSSSPSESKNALNTPTDLGLIERDLRIFKKNPDFKIYEDEDLSIYISEGIKPKITYAYNGEIEGRAYTDRFLLHVHLKDSLKTKNKISKLTLNFIQRPKTVNVEGKTFSVFHQELKSNNYKDLFIPRGDISFIDTGRFAPNKGRSLDLKGLKLKNIIRSEESVSFGDHITIKTTQKRFDKILQKREEALRRGVLITEEKDIIKGEVAFNDDNFEAMDFRLKGDWTDHLVDDKKWSFRIIMKDGQTLKGMRKLSVQHPKVRNFLWEWLFNRVLKDEGVVALRYDFANVNVEILGDDKIQTKNLGIMAIEETFDKILIEHNKKREGVILAFDESLHWKDEQRIAYWKLDDKARSARIAQFPSAPIKVFNENKVLSDPKLKKQFENAKSILESVRQGKLKVSEAFDMEKLSTFVALSNLFGGQHGLVWHNIRIYYNPITNKLEPISYDSHSGIRLGKIARYPMSTNDSIYDKMVLEKLRLVSNSDYINQFLIKYEKNLENLEEYLKTEYSNVFNIETLQYNSNFIKNKINPAQLISVGLISQNHKEIKLAITNLSEYDIIIDDILHKDGRRLSVNRKNKQVLKNSTQSITFTLNTYFDNAFVSKKNKKGTFQYPKDLEKLRVSHFIPGVDHLRETHINPYSIASDLETKIVEYKNSSISNIDEFSFVERRTPQVIRFIEGAFVLDKDLVIPENYKVIVDPGFSLDFKNNASIRSKATLISKGTLEKPIKFYSSDGTGQGIFITNASSKSEIVYTSFDNLSNPQSETWSVSGAVNFHESEVSISNSSFTNNRCEDALNIIRSNFTMNDITFENTQSDSFDGDFVTGTLTRCTFINSGNDGIDVSGSSLVLEDIKVSNPADKGISAGENSQISGNNVEINGGEIGVVSKDLSTVNLEDVRIIDTRLGLSAFQKKSEYGVASIDISDLLLQNVPVAHLIEINSSLTIDDKAVETVSNNVIDQMYGKEYGKSSR